MMRKALTTAELMIALTIIGVIAALVLPSIIENYQNRIYTTKLKKTYMAISNAVEQASVDNDVSSFKYTPYAANNSKSAVESFFNKYLSVTNMNNAFADKYKIIQGHIYTEEEIAALQEELETVEEEDKKKELEDKIRVYSLGMAEIQERDSGVSAGYQTAMLNDGQAIAMLCETVSDNCYIFVDVNGKDEPNMEGRDMFSFRIKQSTNEISDYVSSALCTTGTATIGPANIGNGAGCLTRIMEDNWNMNY